MKDRQNGQMAVGNQLHAPLLNRPSRELSNTKSLTIRKQFWPQIGQSFISFYIDKFRAVSRLGQRRSNGSYRWDTFRASPNAQPSFSLFSFLPFNRCSIPEVLTRAAALSTDIYSDIIRTRAKHYN